MMYQYYFLTDEEIFARYDGNVLEPSRFVIDYNLRRGKFHIVLYLKTLSMFQESIQFPMRIMIDYKSIRTQYT